MTIDRARVTSILESLIFVSEQPLSFRKIRTILDGVPGKELKSILNELQVRYREEGRGYILEEVAEGYQFRTPPENQEWVKMLVEYQPVRLSKAALETLAIIAYQQPVTKTEIEAIRGVDSSSGVSKLMDLGLIKILGRKEMPGRPFIYGTTPEFLEVFNLPSLGDLPSLKDLEEIDPQQIEAYSQKLAEIGGEEAGEDEDDESEPDQPADADETTGDGEDDPAGDDEPDTDDEHPVEDDPAGDDEPETDDEHPVEEDPADRETEPENTPL